MKKIGAILLSLLLIIATVVIGCASSQESSPSRPSTAPMAAPAPAPPMTKDASSTFTSSAPGEGSNVLNTDRKVIRTGQITIQVNEIVKGMDEVVTIANELGGYVVSSNRYGDEDKTSARVVIRVPAHRFSEAFVRLRNVAVKVPYESTNSQDVTEEYTDLKARLRNLEATEAQFLSLLEKAKTVEEILKVQKELSTVRGEIERLKGRIQYLDRSTDMSLIEVNLQEVTVVGKDGWNALDTLKSAVNGLIQFSKVLLDIIIWLIIFIPLWIIIGVIIYFVRKRRKKAKSQASS